MNARRREFAILRALGARRAVVSAAMRAQTGVVLDEADVGDHLSPMS
jgi:predicted lysophospholipase L1 biosynthesis ABC-type transport system permease subunit